MEKQIKQLFSDVSGKEPDDINLTDSLDDDIGLDELDRIELIMLLEAEFHTSLIPDEDADKWETVQDVVDYMVNKD